MSRMALDIWLHRANFKTENASLIWCNLLSTMHIILPELAWLVGHNKLIYIGMDPISSMQNSMLSQPLLGKLHEKSMFLLKQTYDPEYDISPQWRSSSELGLMGTLAA